MDGDVDRRKVDLDLVAHFAFTGALGSFLLIGALGVASRFVQMILASGVENCGGVELICCSSVCIIDIEASYTHDKMGVSSLTRDSV